MAMSLKRSFLIFELILFFQVFYLSMTRVANFGHCLKSSFILPSYPLNDVILSLIVCDKCEIFATYCSSTQ